MIQVAPLRHMTAWARFSGVSGSASKLAPTGSWGPSSGIASTLAPTVGAGLPAIPRHNEKAPEMFDHFRGFVLFNNGGEIGTLSQIVCKPLKPSTY